MKRIFCLLAFCVLLLSCVKENQFGRTTVYTLNVPAVKGGRPDTKALSFDGLKLKATWAVGEEVRVYTGKALYCTLQATSDGERTMLSGTATKALKPGDEIRLEFLSPDYKNQEGTLDYIATHCDYATASVTVSDISREEFTMTTTEACFETRQAIVAFHLVDAANPSRPLAATSLDFNVAGESIQVTPEKPASEVFVAVPAVPGKSVSLTASAGDKVYALYKNDVKLEAAVYYVVTAKMHEAVSLLVHNEAELNAAVQNNNALIRFANDIVVGHNVQITGNRTVGIDMCGFKLDRGLLARGSDGQCFYVTSGSTLHLSNGTLTGGWGGDGGGLLTDGTANLTNVTVSGNLGDNRGGGITCRSGSTLRMTGGAITGNTCNDIKPHPDDTAGGGGLFNDYGATAILSGVTISGNVATWFGGGGICNYGKLTLQDCTVTGNRAYKNGGGIWNGRISEGKYPALLIDGGSITHNQAGDCGGGIFGSNIGGDHGSLSMQGAATVSDNVAAGGVTNNVYLRYRQNIHVTGSLEGSTIGVTMETVPIEFTKGWQTYNPGADPASIFMPDLAGVMSVVVSPNKEARIEKNVPGGTSYYIERAWDAERQVVTATMKYLTEQISDDATPTSETQFKVVASSSSASVNLGTEGSQIHEFYVVNGEVRAKKLIVQGPNVHIILSDQSELILGDAIVVTEGHTVYVHDQGSDSVMGKMRGDYGSSPYSASIGGSMSGAANGGNIEIHGGDIDLKARKASAIGGQYLTKTGDIAIFAGKIRAEGGEGSAGIGGCSFGKNYGNVSIYGGTIHAIGGDNQGDPDPGGGAGIGGGFQCTDGTVHIYGGDITASSNSESAGIGCGQVAGSHGAGTIIIDGGTVKAYGGTHAAGIGGGDSVNGGDVTINGGHVEAYGGDDAAGIGGGEDGNGGTVTITGGYVFAKGGWEYGAGIGGGQDGRGAHVTITGGTVVAQAGLDETGCRAIGPGEGSDDYGTLTLGDNLMVSSERLAGVDERKNMCWYRTRVRVEPCTHPGYTPDTCPYHKH